jgi:hypothetical protein
LCFTDILWKFSFDDGISQINEPSGGITQSGTSKSSPVPIGPSVTGSITQAPSASTASSVASGLGSSGSGQPTVFTPTVQITTTPSSAVGQDKSNQTITDSDGRTSSAAASHFPVAIVVGSVCGVVVAVLLAFGLMWCRRRKSQRGPRLEGFLAYSDSDPSARTPDPAAQTNIRNPDLGPPVDSALGYPYSYPSVQTDSLAQSTSSIWNTDSGPQTVAPPSPVETSTALPPYTPRDLSLHTPNSTTSLLDKY